MRGVQCLDDAAVMALIAGHLDSTARAASEQHLDGCTFCLSLVAAVAGAGSTATDAGSAAAAAADARAAPSIRYQLGAEIARGGMGTVHAARDRLLGRDVAVKLMGRRGGDPEPEDDAGRSPTWSAEIARRFAREVALTARLQHPSIVPIYDSGRLADGTPFYAMRMVAGETLEAAAAAADDLPDRLALVPAVLAAAEAIAYAHSQGIVHRDLKPHNVLVGRFGETVVLDWGLAKDVRAGETDSSTGKRPPSPLGPAGETTTVGSVLGTLAYMPPERLDGAGGDERADVYGLGAILYRVLAGDMPRRRASDEPEPLDRRQPGIPRELLAIVARAMAIDPAGRYASAAELVDDLRRFLNGQLVAAHDYSRADLVRRWMRRHRAAAAAAGLALVAIALVTALSFRRVVDQREAAEAARARAEGERQAAEELIGFMLGDLRVRLDSIGRIDVLGGAARSIDAYFARLPVRAGPDGFTDLMRRGQALSLVGDVALDAGNLDAAAGHYRAARESLRAAAERKPGPAADDALCRMDLRDGDLARARGELGQARDAAARCAATARAYAARGGHPDWQFHLAAGLSDQARAAWVAGDAATARRFLEETEQAIGKLAAAVAAGARTSDPAALENLRAVTADQLAQLGLETGDFALARRAATANRVALERWLSEHKNDADAEYRLALARLKMGDVHLKSGEVALAVAELEPARVTLERLAGRDPANATWLRSLGAALQRSADAELTRERPAAALPMQERSRDISRRLLELTPDSQQLRRDLVVDELTVAQIEQALGHLDRAAETIRRAVAGAEKVRAEAGDVRADEDLAVVLLHQSFIDIARRRHDLAAPAIERGLALRRQLLAADDTPSARHWLALALLLQLDLPPRLRPRIDPCAVLREARAALAPIAEQAASVPDLASAVSDLERAAAAHPRCRS
jgi:tetratricopeptide (TPR) repeat protein